MSRIALKLFVLLAAPLLLLSACASLSPEQCRQADWRQIGYTDGLKGLAATQIDEHAKSCAPVGIRPNFDLYMQGRQQGLLSYCQPENGFQVGRRNASHIAADCPANLRYGFLQQYESGRQIYALESDLASRRRDVSDNYDRIRKSDERIRKIKDDLARKDLSADRRNNLLSDYNSQLSHKERLMRDTSYLQRMAFDAEQRLNYRLRELGR